MTIKMIDVSPEPTKTNRGPKTVFDFASLQVGQGAEFPAGYFKSAVTANNRACAITRKLLPSRFEARAHGDGFIIARVHDYTPEELERRKAVGAAQMAAHAMAKSKRKGKSKAKGNGAAHPAH